MGIHGSSTCALNFGEKGNCIGYLLGQENQGMRIMFNMMNELGWQWDTRSFSGQRGVHAGAALREGAFSRPEIVT